MKLVVLAAGLCLLAAAASPQPIEVARVGYVQGQVETAAGDAAWAGIREGAPVRVGDRFRTGNASRARIDFPWMAVAIDGSSVLSFPNSVVLSAVLEEGRVEPFSRTGSIIKLVTAEAAVRGSGRVVVRRQGTSTFVSVLEGRFEVEPPGEIAIAVEAGRGLILRSGEPPTPPLILAVPPTGLRPGLDPLYVLQGESATFSWTGDAPRWHVELLAWDASDVVVGRDVTTTSLVFELPWLGTFRWRVAAIDAQGLEGLPSEPGAVCVVEK